MILSRMLIIRALNYAEEHQENYTTILRRKRISGSANTDYSVITRYTIISKDLR